MATRPGRAARVRRRTAVLAAAGTGARTGRGRPARRRSAEPRRAPRRRPPGGPAIEPHAVGLRPSSPWWPRRCGPSASDERGQGGGVPAGRRAHGRAHRRGRPAPSLAPSRAHLLGLLHAHPGRPAGRGQPRAPGGAVGHPGAEPTPGRDHRPDQRVGRASCPASCWPRPRTAPSIAWWSRPSAAPWAPCAPTSTCPPGPIWSISTTSPISGTVGDRHAGLPVGRYGARPHSSWWPTSTRRRRWAAYPVTGPWP